VNAKLLDGRAIAGQIKQEISGEVAEFVQSSGITPKLAAVLVGDDPASQVYVKSKSRECERVGIKSEVHRLAPDASENELLNLVKRLDEDQSVHGILVQLPLPPQIDQARILDAVHPMKDVDAFHPENVGLIVQGRPRFLPCTPHGIMQILHRSGIDVAGKEVVVVGRSEIVGKPIAVMLAQRESRFGVSAVNATVTVCHSRTENLPAVTRRADVLIAAIGRARFITSDMIKEGAVVIDVGINRTDEGLVGDVDFEGVKEKASHITPVPGGVGPLTVTMVLFNTLVAARLSQSSTL
jgi:methylenetetrahydrofolate dehydrogenase (NADP+)/methenyltetrahydrofolate cyclohydrolase